jgi:hypothetical protein
MKLSVIQHDHDFCLQKVAELLVLRYLETGEWSWEAAWAAYRDGHGTGKTAQRIGFHSPASRPRHGREAAVARTSAS